MEWQQCAPVLLHLHFSMMFDYLHLLNCNYKVSQFFLSFFVFFLLLAYFASHNEE